MFFSRQKPAKEKTKWHSGIRKPGLPGLLSKGRDLLLMTMAVPIVIAMRLSRPLVLIRIGHLTSFRIGHYAADTEMYLCQRDLTTQRGRTVDIFFNTSPISNHQLKKMWDRTLLVSQLARPVAMANGRIPGGQRHHASLPPDKDLDGMLTRTQTHLSFTAKEERAGQAALRELGIPEGAPFVCFYARDAAYLDAAFPDNEQNWRDHDYRDASIHKLLPAAEELTRRGYFALRMGAVVKEPLNTTNPMIIDYATTGRTDFIDIYLNATCRFFLGDSAGISCVPKIFRRPLGYINAIPIGSFYIFGFAPGSVFIPKKLWSEEQGRFLTFREIVGSEIGSFLDTWQYENLGLQPVENTPEEIMAVAVETDDRIRGTWQKTEEDEQLQRRFWSVYKQENPNAVIGLRVGKEFLRQNRELLD